jgi:oligoendopeptidase F
MSETVNSAAEIVWDLSDLYASPEDPQIEKALSDLQSRAAAFNERYKGKIDSADLNAETLGSALREYESISQESAKPGSYASLRFAADASDPARGAFLQKMMERGTELSIPLIFFDLELAKVSDSVLDPLLADPGVAAYKHYISTVRMFREHMLSETEETLLEETANTGSRAFKRLFDQITSSAVFKLDGDSLSQSEIISRLYQPDRDLRRRAAEAFSAGLAESAPTTAYIFNTLVQDKNVKDRLRSYKYPEQSRHMANELSPETVEVVVQTCVDNYALVNRFYKVKRDILGLDQLTHYDRYAPLFESEERVAWNDAREMVLAAYGAFSPVMREKATLFFEKGWIDAAPRKGKRGGAFCSYITPDLHPYLFQTYLEKNKDVMTLAHEMGHGVHAYLSREQTYLNYYGTLPMAELASTFGEMLVFERLQSEASLQERLALFASKIEDSFATIFRQASMYRFEQAIHKHRREKGELTIDDFGGYWQEAIQSMFGDSVALGEEHRVWWSYVSHFVGSPFYVYAYSFGELLVLSLYQKYREEGEPFAQKYINVLRAGGSLSPQELMDMVCVNLSDPAFWQGGMKVLEREIGQFEQLWGEYKSSPDYSSKR